MSRIITNHIVSGDSSNHQLNVEVLDEPGQGNACHLYKVSGYDTETNVSNDAFVLNHEPYWPVHSLQHGNTAMYGNEDRTYVQFQNGPIKEVGVNGVTHEALLAILIDRMEGFQAGPFACTENADALYHLNCALNLLQYRTKKIERGVEGTHEK